MPHIEDWEKLVVTFAVKMFRLSIANCWRLLAQAVLEKTEGRGRKVSISTFSKTVEDRRNLIRALLRAGGGTMPYKQS